YTESNRLFDEMMDADSKVAPEYRSRYVSSHNEIDANTELDQKIIEPEKTKGDVDMDTEETVTELDIDISKEHTFIDINVSKADSNVIDKASIDIDTVENNIIDINNTNIFSLDDGERLFDFKETLNFFRNMELQEVSNDREKSISNSFASTEIQNIEHTQERVNLTDASYYQHSVPEILGVSETIYDIPPLPDDSPSSSFNLAPGNIFVFDTNIDVLHDSENLPNMFQFSNLLNFWKNNF
ncbi:hypothetical protein NGRA_0497, partial [Nosema granulosis]